MEEGGSPFRSRPVRIERGGCRGESASPQMSIAAGLSYTDLGEDFVALPNSRKQICAFFVAVVPSSSLHGL